jgi:hypothetical protein
MVQYKSNNRQAAVLLRALTYRDMAISCLTARLLSRYTLGNNTWEYTSHLFRSGHAHEVEDLSQDKLSCRDQLEAGFG